MLALSRLGRSRIAFLGTSLFSTATTCFIFSLLQGKVFLPLKIQLTDGVYFTLFLPVKLFPDLQQEVLELVQDVQLRLGKRSEGIVRADIIADDAGVIGAKADVLGAEDLLTP